MSWNLTGLNFLHARGNQLASLTLAPGLTNLVNLIVSGNQLRNLTLPPDMTRLTLFIVDGNPLTTLVLSEPLAVTNLAATIANLKNQGIPVFTHPLTVQLAPVREQPIGAFRFSISGRPGDYTVFSSTNLITWSVLGLDFESARCCPFPRCNGSSFATEVPSRAASNRAGEVKTFLGLCL